jgi:hypothetical protein
METISFKLTKVETFNELKPYGKFIVKWKTRQGHLPNIIPFDELNFNSETTMPVDDVQDKIIIKFMKKHKTDVLTDGYRFYGRIGKGFGEIYHKKLGMYRDNEGFKNLVDNGDTFSAVMLNR